MGRMPFDSQLMGFCDLLLGQALGTPFWTYDVVLN